MMLIEVDGYTAEVEVTSERDPYGTGDSPRQYYVDIQWVANADGDEVDLTDQLEDLIAEEAIGVYING